MTAPGTSASDAPRRRYRPVRARAHALRSPHPATSLRALRHARAARSPRANAHLRWFRGGFKAVIARVQRAVGTARLDDANVNADKPSSLLFWLCP
jgi:hypothetical protein